MYRATHIARYTDVYHVFNTILFFSLLGQISVPVMQETPSTHTQLPGFHEIRTTRRSGLFEIRSSSFCVGDFISIFILT